MTTRSNGADPRRPHYASSGYGGGYGASASLKGCCCCLLLLLTFLALLAVAVALVVVLVLKPRKPQFSLQQVTVQYLLVTAPNPPSASSVAAPAAAYLSLNITLLFTAINPNKVGIRYSPAAFDVMYRGVPLGVAAVPGFEQPSYSKRLVESRVSVDRFNVLQADAQQLVQDAAVNDRVDLRITGDVAARVLLLGFSSPRVQVSVDCTVVISPRRQQVTYKQCGVDGVNF